MNDSPRDRWQSRTRFVLAAVGSAVGLGNIWRFPYIAYTSGGGAFMIPYLVALLTAGIPLLILEFTLGQRYQSAAPRALRSLNPRAEWIGWWAVGVSMVIVLYYSVIMAWAWDYLVFSLTQAWGNNAEAFFNQRFLGLTGDPGKIGKIQGWVILGLAATWISIYWIISKGVIRVGKVVVWSVTLPIILLFILVIRGVTLPGALEGLSYYLTPDFSKLLDPKVWLAAYGQVFFSIGIGWGIMIAYASYQPPDSDITNNAFMTTLIDGGISYLAGFAVFSTVGYLASLQGVAVPDAVTSGFGLAFIAYPTAISAMPFGSAALGVVFFLMLLTLGIDSGFSMVEAVISSMRDRWNFTKERAALVVCVVGFLLGLVFCTSGGYYLMDIVDHWISVYGLAVVGMLQCIVAGWMFKTSELRNFFNAISDFKIGWWWDFCIRWLTPGILVVMLVQNLFGEFTGAYGGYPAWSLWIFGWLMIAAVIGISLYLGRNKAGRQA